MKIRDKEVGFLYNVGAYCDYNDWCVANKQASIATANLVKIECMSRAYADANGTKDYLTVAELRKLMPYELLDIIDVVNKAEEEGSTRQIETVDTPDAKKKGTN